MGLFTGLASLAKEVVGTVGGLSVAYTLYEIYHAAFLFMRGGTNAQKREEAKTHLVHVAIGAAFIGSAGLILFWMLHLLPN